MREVAKVFEFYRQETPLRSGRWRKTLSSIDRRPRWGPGEVAKVLEFYIRKPDGVRIRGQFDLQQLPVSETLVLKSR